MGMENSVVVQRKITKRINWGKCVRSLKHHIILTIFVRLAYVHDMTFIGLSFRTYIDQENITSGMKSPPANILLIAFFASETCVGVFRIMFRDRGNKNRRDPINVATQHVECSCIFTQWADATWQFHFLDTGLFSRGISDETVVFDIRMSRTQYGMKLVHASIRPIYQSLVSRMTMSDKVEQSLAYYVKFVNEWHVHMSVDFTVFTAIKV